MATPPPALGNLHESESPLLSRSSPAAPVPPGGSAGDSASRMPGPAARRDGGGPTAPSPRARVLTASRAPRGASVPSSRMSSPSARRERGDGLAPDRAASRSSAHISAVPSAPASRPDPSVLVLGSSMVRHVRIKKGHTSCHPGALVKDIIDSAPTIIRHHPTVSAVVIHIGTNDLKLQQSEILKDNFKILITTIHSLDKQCIISGPFVPPRFGDEKFSRLRALHIWLKRYCRDNKIPYVDNFITFFKRPELFKKDRLHPNIPGSRLLSYNIELTLAES
ncbi:hypothetical protein NL108_018336 [Boleophthalmus pectinirostris]|nr:hypothetical protein NL108_018336 [Boleophthalmus pectinirostris]